MQPKIDSYLHLGIIYKQIKIPFKDIILLMKLQILIFLISCFLATDSYAANCTATINDLITYLTTLEPGYNRYLTFQMASMKAPAKYIGFTSGGTVSVGWRFVSVGSLTKIRLLQQFLMVKDAKTVFSDRTWCPQQAAEDFFCFGYQYFDYRKADTVQLSFYKDSTIKTVLTTWGNATYTNKLQCKDGFMYGSIVDSSGNAFMSISFYKGKSAMIK